MREDTGTDLTFGFPYARPRDVEASLRHLAGGGLEPEGVWPVLMRSKVYVVGAHVRLDESGPRVELPVTEDAPVGKVLLYTSRAALPPGTRDAQVVSLPFAQVLPQVAPWVSVVFDPGTEGELQLDPLELVRLRRRHLYERG